MCEPEETTSIHDAIMLGISSLLSPVDVEDVDWNKVFKSKEEVAYIPDVFKAVEHALEHLRAAASQALKKEV